MARWTPSWRWWLACGVVGATGVAAWWTRRAAGEEVLKQLEARGFDWTLADESFTSLHLTNLKRDATSIADMRIALAPRPMVTLAGVDIELNEIQSGGGTPDAPDTSPAAAALPVHVRDVTVRWGDDVLVSGWKGTLSPILGLSGPDGHVARDSDGAWSGHLARPLALGPLSGNAEVDARCAEQCEVTIHVADAIFEHPLLAHAPLPPSPLHLNATWDRGHGTVSASARFADITVNVEGEVAVTPSLSANLRWDIPDISLSAIVEVFGDLIPEARRAQVVGTVGATGAWSWPDGDWDVQPRFADLGVDGAIANLYDLQTGPVTWTVPDPSGIPRVLRTGDGYANWVPFAAAGLFPAAVMAAEDSAFPRHQGIDLSAIEAAIAQGKADGVDNMRGGSTITQQLAKNLFLDTRERTLVRKLREALYAIEMDRVLPKQRILELYINVVELGDDIYGVGPAAEAYFLKRPGRLTAQEAAFLAALLPAPKTMARRAWYRDRPPTTRMDAILGNMRDMGRITAAEANEARRSPLRLVPPP